MNMISVMAKGGGVMLEAVMMQEVIQGHEPRNADSLEKLRKEVLLS